MMNMKKHIYIYNYIYIIRIYSSQNLTIAWIWQPKIMMQSMKTNPSIPLVGSNGFL